MYKYYSFNEHSKNSLENSTIYFSRFDLFNDPFECWCTEINGYPDPITDRDRYLSVIKTWGFSADRADEAIETYNTYVDEIGDIPGLIDSKRYSARIACFCAEPNNLLMWSHYGDGLRGFCIEFDDCVFDEVSSNNYPIELHQVKYRTSPPSVDTVAYSIAHDMFWHCEDADEGLSAMFELDSKILATKPYPWAYESEIRAITHVKNDDIGLLVDYSPLFIKCIIVGDKAKSTDIEFIREIIAKLNPRIILEFAFRAQESYQVGIRR